MKQKSTPPAGEAGSKVFSKEFFDFLAKLPTFKARLKKRNLTAGRVECPRCRNKTLVLTLKGTNNHLWMACANKECNFKMVE